MNPFLASKRQTAAQRTAVPSVTTGLEAGACFHCGLVCLDERFAREGKNFCCLGCQTVYRLLHESGLAQFYELSTTPGIRIGEENSAAKWTYLDDPAIQEKLFEYADKTEARVTFHLPAIHCVACVWLLENLFKLHPGIGQTVVNFPRREATIVFVRERIKLSGLAALLTSIGYEPEILLSGLEKPTRSPLSKRAWLQIGLAGFAFGNIMLMSIPIYFGLNEHNGPLFKALSGWLGLALALPVVTFSAGDFWRTAWLGLQQRTLTLEVPIVIGLSAIYLTSVREVLAQHGPGYCDSLCGLIFFLLCGRVFQRKTYDRITFDRDYKGFFPLAVMRKTPTGEESVAISRLQIGDHLLLRNGELLPADATLTSDEAWIDYSFVTGESEPVKCDLGAHLYAGGRQVGGVIEVATIKNVEQSHLARLWENEAFTKKGDEELKSLTNAYSRRFTKIIVGIALASALYWMVYDSSKALKAFTSVLIVACPCALALAAPLTQGMAQRLLARQKIFLRNALVTERMATVDTIVFDKTGTLTCAGSRGVDFMPSGATLTRTEWDAIAALARYSTHPHSVRIARSLGKSTRPVGDYQETPGGGISGDVGRLRIQIGSCLWLETQGVTSNETEIDASHSAVAINGCYRGAFIFENSLRPEVAQLIASLGNQYDLALVSGDNERDAGRFRQLFFSRAVLRFNQSPADKLDFIRKLQEQGRKVMMIGDGLNDAGALRQADVGVAVVERIGVFSPASDMILDASELPGFASVLRFSRRTVSLIRAGFVISALYNIVGVSIAAAGLLSPVVCAIIMPLSSATVVIVTSGLTAWHGTRLSRPTSPFPIARNHEPAATGGPTWMTA